MIDRDPTATRSTQHGTDAVLLRPGLVATGIRGDGQDAHDTWLVGRPGGAPSGYYRLGCDDAAAGSAMLALAPAAS